jgi:hypothetical protein
MKKQARNIAFAMMAFAALSFAACTEKENDPQDQQPRCKLTGLVENYSEIHNGQTNPHILSHTFLYDSNNRLYRWIELDGYWQFTYNNAGQISKYEYFYQDVIYWYGDFSNSGNIFTVQFYEKTSENSWSSELKTDYTLSSSNEIEKIEDYQLIEGNWVKTWYVINTWQNGNLLLQKTYQSPNFKSPNTKFHNKFIKREKVKSAINEDCIQKEFKDGFLNISTSSYTYDTNNNPFNHQAAFRFFSSGAMIASKNNVLTTIHEYNSETSNASFNYQYNEYNFPIKWDVSGQVEENYSWTEEWNFSYECN